MKMYSTAQEIFSDVFWINRFEHLTNYQMKTQKWFRINRLFIIVVTITAIDMDKFGFQKINKENEA